ncbi:amino acid adenylation domain-containing protein [Streptomyces sp. NPDC017979]|uniref:amino acid adenylation domain-containing protein n=1 Tax=Streptomyces sp. NPDC017979 TaxID=3365024 RepID=UPI0037B7B9EE
MDQTTTTTTTATAPSPHAALPLARRWADEPAPPPHRAPLAVPPATPTGADRRHLATAALAALLHRYTGENELLVGTPDGTVELKVTGDATGAELLTAVAAARPAPAAHPPMAVVTDARSPSPPGPTGPASPALHVPDAEPSWEVALPGGWFDAPAAVQYAHHLQRLLTALVTQPDTALRDLALLTGAEEQRALVDWNRTDEAVPAPFFHEVVAEHARRTPDALAVALPDARVTYRELDAAANRLAHRLRALGVRPRDRVGVCLPRGADNLTAQLACFKLAVAVVLLDPGFPGDRVRFMVQDSSAAAVVTLADHVDLVPDDRPVLALDDPEEASWRTGPVEPVSEPVSADDIIHVGYTSGSTGEPKAVLARFGSARNLIHGMRTLCRMTADSHGTWLAAPGYGMIQVECFPVLASGATVHIPEATVVASPERLRSWLLAEGITTTLLMKPMAERLWALPWPKDTPLRDIRVCGERIQSWPPAGLPFRLINLYGSTEATTVASCDITELGLSLGDEGRARLLPPIGRPICNVRTYVLDEAFRPVPPGVVGELCITGDGLSAGYLDRPELTGQKWIPNPVSPADYPVLYRTGDMARYWPDGSIEIVGRTDNQIKVRGNTVHLGEIEVVLAAQPGVRQAAVLAHRDAHGDVQLAAYIEPVAGRAPVVRDVRKALRQRLPAFMVPSAYLVGDFPTSTNGKIDRKALPEPPRSRPDIDSAYQAPGTETERALTALWEQVLEIDGIGVLDNFFELGGDSLRAARLTERVRTELGADLEVGDLFDRPSVAHMAELVAAGAPARAA